MDPQIMEFPVGDVANMPSNENVVNMLAQVSEQSVTTQCPVNRLSCQTNSKEERIPVNYDILPFTQAETVTTDAARRLVLLVRLPRALAEWIASLDLSVFTLIAALTIFYIVIGMFLDGISAVVLTMAVIEPMVNIPAFHDVGFTMIWFGIFVTVVVEMAQITPPVGFNLFVLQAMACAIPVVSSAAGGVFSLITDNETGLIVPKKDISLFADKIQAFLENRSYAEKIGLNGLDVSLSHSRQYAVAFVVASANSEHATGDRDRWREELVEILKERGLL